jgi:heme oxygenase (biliverdin-producing, ferredoxin)
MTEPGFASVVREAIRQEQAEADHLPFAAELASDRLTVDVYLAFLAQTYVIDDLLEQAAEAQGSDPIAGRFVVPELHRASAIETELTLLVGDGWRDELRLTAATKAYVNRLREVAFTWPGGFVAHYCTRYLADRSAGHVASPPVDDQHWALLDAAAWEGTERDRVVDEIRLALRLNAAVFTELVGAPSHHRVA